MSNNQKLNIKRKLEEYPSSGKIINNLPFRQLNNSFFYKKQKITSYSQKRKCNEYTANENFNKQNVNLSYCCQVHGDKDICDIYECSGMNIIPKLNEYTYFN